MVRPFALGNDGVLTLHLFLSASFGVLPTPSPELGHPHAHVHPADIFTDGSGAHGALPTWETLDEPAIPVGSKRPHSNDYSVEDFFTDMKKRRVNPAYDTRKSPCPLRCLPL